MRYGRDILGHSMRHAGQIKAWPSVPFSTKVNEKLLAIPTAVLLRRCPSRPLSLLSALFASFIWAVPLFTATSSSPSRDG